MPEIRVKEGKSARDWDAFIAAHDTGGIYLNYGWRLAVENSYKHRTFYLTAEKNGMIAGILPLVRINTIVGKKELVSLPFCDYGGVPATSDAIAAELLHTAIKLAERHNGTLEIRSACGVPAAEESGSFISVTRKCRLLLPLPDSPDELWRSFKSKLRSQIRRPRKEGLVFRMGAMDLVDDFYAVFCQNMRDLGSPVHSRKWFVAVLQSYREQARVGVVYKADTPVAGGIVLTHGATATLPWASSLRRFNRLGTNMLLYWNFLKYACENGFEQFDFGRSDAGSGTYRFKRQWGARPEPLHWYRMKPPREKKGTSVDTESAKLFFRVFWQHLPLPVANFFGPYIRKFISL